MKEKKHEKTGNSVWTTAKTVWKDPKGKAFLFFGFYILFFIFLGVSFRTASQPKEKFKIPILTEENNVSDSVESIEKGNYHFIYNENVHGIEKHLEGKSYNKMKEVTSSSNQMYFLYHGISLIHQDEVWQISENPFYLREIMEEDLLKEVLSKATFISKTVYQSKEILYHYEISTSTLYQLYHNEEIDLADDPNQIDVLLSKDGEISKVRYDYSSYETYMMGTPTPLLIEVSYQDFGKIEAFEVPN